MLWSGMAISGALRLSPNTRGKHLELGHQEGKAQSWGWGSRRASLSERPVGYGPGRPLPRANAGPAGSAGRVGGGRGTRSAKVAARTDPLPLFLTAGYLSSLNFYLSVCELDVMAQRLG